MTRPLTQSERRLEAIDQECKRRGLALHNVSVYLYDCTSSFGIFDPENNLHIKARGEVGISYLERYLLETPAAYSITKTS